MPNVSDVRPTSHDRHDPMLVAALAAGDLAGTDRDQAIALTRTCSDCATLHDDLQALARATAAAPPPIATRPRDFRLTPADASRLRPSGWRRLITAVSSSRSVVTRPLGAGLATIGLVGLLIGNVSLGANSAAALPNGAPAGAGARSAASDLSADAVASASAGAALAPVSVPAASAAAASIDPRYTSESQGGGASSSGLPGAVRGGVVQAAPTDASATSSAPTTGDLFATRDSAPNEPLRPQNVLFGAAILVGLGLLVASWRRGRRTA